MGQIDHLTMPAKRINIVLKIENGVAYVDVSTKRYPAAVALLDPADLPLMLDGGPKWCVMLLNKRSRKLYVARTVSRGECHRKELLHRSVLGLLAPEDHGDHRDGDGLNNRRENLRRASPAQNAQNSVSQRGSTSAYRGVSWDAARGKWTATVRHESGAGRRSLGRFVTEEEAARAYDAAALELYGEFARVNFPEKQRA